MSTHVSPRFCCSQNLTHLSTKKELVNFALEELVKRMKRRKILGFEGKVKWEGNLDESRLGRV